METFRQFLLEFRPQHFAVAVPLNLLINTVVMRITAHRLMDTGGSATWLRCFGCAALLYLVSSLAIYTLMFPAPIIFLTAGFVWLLGSGAIIRSMFDLLEGGFGILALYILVLTGTHAIVRQLS